MGSPDLAIVAIKLFNIKSLNLSCSYSFHFFVGLKNGTFAGFLKQLTQ